MVASPSSHRVAVAAGSDRHQRLRSASSSSTATENNESDSANGVSESNERSSEQQRRHLRSESGATAATTASPASSSLPGNGADDGSGSTSDRASLVVAPNLEQVTFESWEAFYEYLAEYQAQSYQHFRLRSTTSVDERNKRIQTSASSARAMPAEWGVYAKTLVCTHAGKYRYRGTGKRQWHETRPMDCKAKINVCVQWQRGRFAAVVTRADLGHNHQLSKAAYSQYTPNRLAVIRRLSSSNATNTNVNVHATSSKPSHELLHGSNAAKRLRGKHLLQARSDAARRAAADTEAADDYERKEEPIVAHWVIDALYFAHARVNAVAQSRAAAVAHATSRGLEHSLPPQLTFVDVGCSTGALSLAFAEQYLQITTSVAGDRLALTSSATLADNTSSWRVIATDMDTRMLARVDEKLDAQPRYQRFRNRVSTVQMDGQLLDKLADASVDVIGSNFGLSIFPDRVQAWRSAARVLRDGGMLFATVWDAQSPNLRWVDGCAALARAADASTNIETERDGQHVVTPSMRVGHASVVSELYAAGLRDVEMYRTRHSVMYESPRAFVDSTLDNPGFADFIARAGRERLELFLYSALAREGGFAGRTTMSETPSVEELKRVARPVVLDFVAHVVIASKQVWREQ